MLLGELADVFRAAIADYNRLAVEQLIRRAIHVLSWKGTPESYAYTGEAYSLKAEAEAIMAGESDLLRSGRARAAFAAPLFANLLPGDIARQVRSFLTVDIVLSAPTTEAQFLLLRFQSSKALMENFVQVANSLGLYPFPLPRERVTLCLRLPRGVFAADLARLGEILIFVDEFLAAVGEGSGGAGDKPVVHYASDAVLTLYVSIDPRQAVPVLAHVKACLDAAVAAAAFEAALGELDRAAVAPEAVAQVAGAREASERARLGEAFDAAAAGLGTQPDRDRARTVRLGLRMVRAMQEGLEIQLLRPLEASGAAPLPAEDALGETTEIDRLLADTAASQARLNTLISRDVAVAGARG